ncbi:hypothetical protein BG003_008968 [Podila horticola]|nr:hypothetical protein BG003_008968 [Podila horticola]
MFYNHPGSYFHLSYPRNCRVQSYNFMPPSLKNPPTTTALSTTLGRPKTSKDRGTIFDPNHTPYKDNIPDSNLDPDQVNCPDSQILIHCTNGQERAGELLARLRIQGSSHPINHSAVTSMAESIRNTNSKSKSKTNSTTSNKSNSPRTSFSRNSSKSSAFKTDSIGSGHTFGDSRTRSVLMDDIQLLKAQIMQATLVLNHVIQTMTVPSPAALLDFASKRGLLLGKDIARDEGCNCASLHIQQDWTMQSHGHGHGLNFLVAYYSPDPWEFQSRVICQIACMQQEVDALRRESLEAQKRATIQLRKEVMEWERSRDVEWVELNERMQNAFLLATDADEESGSEYYRRSFKKGIKSDDSGEESDGKWVRVDENKLLLAKRDKEKLHEELVWKTKAATIHDTWAGAVTPLAGGPLFPNKVRDEEGFGREVFWAGDYSSSQFSPIPSAPHSREE